jgi:hypothetical protein
MFEIHRDAHHWHPFSLLLQWCEPMSVWNWASNGPFGHPRDIWVNMEQQWNDINRGNQIAQRKTCPSANLSATNPTWSARQENQGLHGEKLATYCLSYGTANILCKTVEVRRLLGHSTSNQRRKETFPTRPHQNWMIFCEIVVPTEIRIPAKFYCFMATRFLRADIQSCKTFNAQVMWPWRWFKMDWNMKGGRL